MQPDNPGRARGGRADGVAVIDKPAGWTSHDVVAKARGVLGTRKVGHSGTLDPDATGVLVLGVGRATRLLRFLTELPKSYEAEIVLGVETDTLDSSGRVTALHDMPAVTEPQARHAAAALTGDILQVPPMVSAVKVGGRRLHELARAGVEVERKARPVTVHRFEVARVPGCEGVLRAVVDCSSGTYVRVLAAELGHALGGGAHLRALRRTAVGSFELAQARPLESAEVLAMAEAVKHLTGLRVGPEVAADVANGRVLDLGRLGVVDAGDGRTTAGPWAVHDREGRLLAVYERFRDGAKPAVVVASVT